MQLHELYLIVDHNKLQSDLAVKEINDLGDLEAKFESFMVKVMEIILASLILL